MLEFWNNVKAKTPYRPDEAFKAKNRRNPAKTVLYVPMASANFKAYVENNHEHGPWVASLVKGLSPISYDFYVLPRDCLLLYVPHYLSQEQCGRESELRRCLDGLETTSDPGVPREYVGYKRELMPKPLAELCDDLNVKTGFDLGSVYVNKYRQNKVYDAEGNWIAGAGKDSIMPHRDREMSVLKHQVIVCVSVGQKRKFVVRYENPDRNNAVEGSLEFRLGEGDLLIMAGKTNVYCTHAVPKEEGLDVKDHRFSMTFRQNRPKYPVLANSYVSNNAYLQ